MSTQTIQVGLDSREKFVIGATHALALRAGAEKPDPGNEFMGMTLPQIAAEALKRVGVSVTGCSPIAVTSKVFASQSNSDFPRLLSNVAGKVLRKAYGVYPSTYQQIAYVGSVPDFKISPRIQLGSFNGLDVIQEGGEYKYGSLGEYYENAQAETKGKALRLSRQMIINDDLGGFNRMAQVMGRSAARSVNADLYALITSGAGNNGPTGTDSIQYFNATAPAAGHGNLTGTGTAISSTSIALGRSMMRKQKDKDLRENLNILPHVLLCPIVKEDAAWTVLNSATDVTQANPNKKNYTADVARLNLVTDPYLDGISTTAWYLFAHPEDAGSAFEVVFLGGQQEPYVDEMVDFHTDSMKFKVRLDYGIAIGDWRGGYKNAGA